MGAHFQSFGELDNINLKTDPATGRSRGFAFVVFKTVEGLKDAVSAEEHAVKGKKVAVKKAQAKQGKVYVGKLKAELKREWEVPKKTSSPHHRRRRSCLLFQLNNS